MQIAMGESVDFKLLYSTSEENYKIVENSFKKRNWEIYKIGRFFKEKNPPRVMIEHNGKKIKVKGKVWKRSDFKYIQKQ